MSSLATLERSVGYALGCLALVGGTPAGAPTPCRGWDLTDLLHHLDDSCTALAEAVRGGVLPPRVSAENTENADDDTPRVLAARVAARARQGLGEWIAAGDRHLVAVGDCALPARLVIGVGALELAVHSWDVARACGQHRPIPAGLAEDLHALAADLVCEQDRPTRFAPAVQLPVHPAPAHRPPDAPLLAFLGRTTPTPIPS